MQTQVINNCQGPHYVQRPHVGRNAGSVLVLNPGLNLIDAAVFAEVKRNPGFARLFELTIKPSLSETADPRKFHKPMLEVRGELKQPVPALPLKEALALVELAENTDLLAEWRAGCLPEKNQELIKAIDARLKAITGLVALDASYNQPLARK